MTRRRILKLMLSGRPGKHRTLEKDPSVFPLQLSIIIEGVVREKRMVIKVSCILPTFAIQIDSYDASKNPSEPDREDATEPHSETQAAK